MRYKRFNTMTIKTSRAHKPNLMLLVTFFVGVGFVATNVAHAAEDFDKHSIQKSASKPGGLESWWESVWGLDLAEKLRNWRPSITVRDDGEGLNLARPFGKSGPTIQCSSSLPDSVARSLRAGGDNQIGAFGTESDAFVFLQKRW